MIKAVIFDYGGVIKSPVSWWKDIGLAYNISEKKAKEKMKPYLDSFQSGHIAEIQFWKEISENFKKPVPKTFILKDKKDYDEGFYIYPEMINFVKYLKEKGVKTAVMSNTTKPHVRVMRKHNGFDGFDVVVNKPNKFGDKFLGLPYKYTDIIIARNKG